MTASLTSLITHHYCSLRTLLAGSLLLAMQLPGLAFAQYPAQLLSSDTAVGAQDLGPWSKTVMLTMDHHPLSRAFMFFGLGLLVFVATVVLILHGAEWE